MQDLTDHNEKINQLVTDPMSYNPLIPPNIMTYNMDEHKSFSTYDSESVNLFAEKEKMKTNADYAYAESNAQSQCATTQLCSACNLKVGTPDEAEKNGTKNGKE